MTDKEKLKRAHRTIKRQKQIIKDLRIRERNLLGMISSSHRKKSDDEISPMIKQMAWNSWARSQGF